MSSIGPSLIGAFLFLQLVSLRLLTWADTNRVWVLGRELHWGCWFKERFGIPCPTCGMTRSVILTVHGRLAQALVLNPGGPVLVAGIALLGFLMFQQGVSKGRSLSRRMVLVMVLYGWVLAIVIISQWLIKLS